jgi:uncharacterized protein (DUF433 family)
MSQQSTRIVSEVHDEPHLEGRRVTVRRIQGLVEGADNSAADVADQLDLDIADVYAALQYFHAHPEEIAAAARNQRERERDARAAGAVSLAELEDEGSERVSDSR